MKFRANLSTLFIGCVEAETGQITQLMLADSSQAWIKLLLISYSYDIVIAQFQYQDFSTFLVQKYQLNPLTLMLDLLWSRKCEIQSNRQFVYHVQVYLVPNGFQEVYTIG
ncbi:UNKNOWN [Stylonychia lemnae]|uniref:Uncharacterized protein n=1 Tax=Stylonychia lemnae TaxID=5949 RepID=A0A078A7H9_STYLE|nr:UNKNOWN [Stylonychia lemnae]|eukprot:CDW76746.1 UNKNOWN [Stylonychia lemnae]